MNTYFVISIQEHAFLDAAYNNFAEKEPHSVRRADCAGNGLMGHQNTLTHTHTHTQMQALNPTPKHLFRVFLSSLETKELELETSVKSLKVPAGC